MTHIAWHRFTLAHITSVVATVVLIAGVAALHRNTVVAGSHSSQQQVIIIDDREEECFNPPCRFELYYHPTHAQRDWFKDSRTADTTYNDHAYWANTQPSRGIVLIEGGAIWRPFVMSSGSSGQYRVAVFIPRVATGMADTRCATYYITHAGGESSVEVSQRASAGTWVGLGTYRFTGSPSEQIRLDWNVDNITCDGGSSSILFDAVRLEPVDTSPITVNAYLRDLPEGATVAPGTTVWHCFSVSRPTPIRWWWQNPSSGWRMFSEWDDDGQGACRASEPLQEAGIRRTRIEAVQDGRVLATDETYFYVDSPTVHSTTTPTPSPTSRPTAAPQPTATTPASLSVWIEGGCGRTYSIGQSIRVGVQADTTGIGRLTFEPQGIEFAVRSLRAGSPDLIDTSVEGPPGAQAIEARLEVSNKAVATASCKFSVMALPTPTPSRPATSVWRCYFPAASRAATMRPTSTAIASPIVLPSPTSASSRTPTTTATRPEATQTVLPASRTPRPIRTATPEPITLTVLEVKTTALNEERLRTTFADGEGISFWLHVRNSGQYAVNAAVTFRVLGEGSLKGTEYTELGWSGSRRIEPGESWIKVDRQPTGDPMTSMWALASLHGTVSHEGLDSEATCAFAVGTLFLEDDFSDPLGGWPAGQAVAGQYGYFDSTYRILLESPNAWLSARAPVPYPGFGAVEVDAWAPRAVDGRVGLAFGMDRDAVEQHVLAITRDGQFAVYRHIPTGWISIVGLRASSALRQGDAVNHLMVVREQVSSDNLSFADTSLFANGQLILTLPDLSTSEEGVGLNARDVNPGFEARFDYFRVVNFGILTAAETIHGLTK